MIHNIRRSVLYIPALNTKALSKIASLACDAVIVDLEDAVATQNKDAARSNVVDFLIDLKPQTTKEILVRINSPATEFYRKDLAAIAPFINNFHGIVLPKAERDDDVCGLHEACSHYNTTDKSKRYIWLLLETPLGIIRAHSLATSSPAVTALVMGTSDLAQQLQLPSTLKAGDRKPFWYSLSQCVVAARAAGVSAIDGVHLDLSNDKEFEAACAEGKNFGFDGKTLIHPKTIDTCNRVFSPDAAEVALATEIVAQWEAANTDMLVLNGKLIESLHYNRARQIVGISKRCM